MIIFGRQPAAWVGLIMTLILGAVSTLLGEGLISDALAGQVTNAITAIGQILTLLAPLIAGLLIRPQVTPVTAPQLPAGTEVAIEGTNATSTVGRG